MTRPSDIATPAMESQRFQMRTNAALGLDVRLASNPEAQKTWSCFEIKARGARAIFNEVEEWCASVLAHVDGEAEDGYAVG